jgi:hypothetical protein
MQRVKWKDRLSEWMNRSELLMMGNEALRIKGPEVLARIKAQFGRKASASGGRPHPTADLAALAYLPELPDTQESWRIGEAFLQQMQDDCRRHAAEFWIVVIGMPVEVSPDLSVRAALAERLGLPTLGASDERLAAFAEAHGIHALLLAPEMGRYAASHRIALHGFGNTAFGHWNETGHRVAARLITQELLHSSRALSKLR